MTDIPMQAMITMIPGMCFPILDAGVGRIFADNASTLIEMINGLKLQ